MGPTSSIQAPGSPVLCLMNMPQNKGRLVLGAPDGEEGRSPLVSSSLGLDKVHVCVVRGDISKRPVLRSEVV